MKKPRCHDCRHPDRHRRVVTARKAPCDCACHTPPEARALRRRRRSMPAWFEDYEAVEDEAS